MKDIVFPKRMTKDCRKLFKTWGWDTIKPEEKITVKKPCQHLNSGNICGIYESRPAECKNFICAKSKEIVGYNGAVLVACVTFAGKEPCLDLWLEAYRNLDYENKHLFVVDNTGISDGYLKTLREKGIDSTRIYPSPKFEETYRRGWELILHKAKELDCYWVYSIEADNIVGPESLKSMLTWAMIGNGKEGEERIGGVDQNVHIVTHGYPMHESTVKASGVDPNSYRYQEMGCMLMTTQLLELAMAEWGQYRNIPYSIMSTNKKYNGKHIYLDYQFEVQHLDTFETEWWQFEPMEEKLPDGSVLVCPAPAIPPEYGTKKPKSIVGTA
jgi:hypothetical protein